MLKDVRVSEPFDFLQSVWESNGI